ncbi:KPN_02809 family neutral zinc metallopeptidase [Luteimicrobium subarcticum]|nr:neutral zinc metallopeptidase [Luteimicrobium subarcticum]
MTFSDGSHLDPDRVRRRGPGRTTAIAGGGIGTLVVALLAIFLGNGSIDLSGLTSGSDAGDESGTDCTAGADANRDAECRYVATLESTDAYWAKTLPDQAGVRYTEPEAVSFSGSTSSGCGTASSATGPFYCPSDGTVYLDVAFFDDLTSQYGANGGPLAQEYVVAHEVGHHVQDLTGVLDRAGGHAVGADEGSVRTELMADCLGGMWAHGASSTKDASGTPFLEKLTQQDVADALSAAAAVGDDRLQRAGTGHVDPDSWTHGSAAQREAAFRLGYSTGSYDRCAAILTKGV